MGDWDRNTTTDEVLAGHDLSGRRVVITGTSSGLGVESARALSARGAAITMLARDAAKNEAAAKTVREAVPEADLETRVVDLTRFDSIRACAAGLLADHDAIHVLMLNAGVMVCPFSQNEQGFENHLLTNHLGHFLLTLLLTPALVRGAPSRLVVLSSGAHD